MATSKQSPCTEEAQDVWFLRRQSSAVLWSDDPRPTPELSIPAGGNSQMSLLATTKAP